VVTVEAFDWNCPQHITPRFTLAEIESTVAPLRARIAELESQLAEREPGARVTSQPGGQKGSITRYGRAARVGAGTFHEPINILTMF
jgi:hypothetical protein